MPKLSNTRQNQAVDYPKFMTATQASRVSGIGENKLRELMDKGELEFVQIGSHRRTTLKALDDWYENSKVKRAKAEQARSAVGV